MGNGNVRRCSILAKNSDLSRKVLSLRNRLFRPPKARTGNSEPSSSLAGINALVIYLPSWNSVKREQDQN